MAGKLSAFLRVLGSGLSQQAFQANVGTFRDEQADIRQRAGEERAEQRDIKNINVGQIFKTLGPMGVALRNAKSAGDMGAVQRISGQIAEVANQYPEHSTAIKNSVMASELAQSATGKGKHFPAITPEGERVAAIQDESGRIVDATTGKHMPDWIKAPTRQETGPAGAFTKKIESDIQDRLLKGKLAKDRLAVIKAGFKPEFTEIGTKASTKLTAFAEKVGLPTSKSSQEDLNEFTSFARNSTENLNQHIRDRTGAVMNAAEIPRLMQEMPVLGTGLLDGDSATQYMSKLNGVMKTLEAAEARLLFAQENGLGSDPESFSAGLPLGDFKDVPPMPSQFNASQWHKMTPADRRRLVNLMKAKK